MPLPDWFAPLAIAGGTAAAAGIGAGRGRRSQRRQRNFSRQQAQYSRNWAETMDSTKFQRAVLDMKSAGLNPAMMYGSGGGGLSSPTSSSAPGISMESDATSGFGQGISSAIQMSNAKKKLNAELELIKKQKKSVRLDNDLKELDLEKWRNSPLPSNQQFGRFTKEVGGLPGVIKDLVGDPEVSSAQQVVRKKRKVFGKEFETVHFSKEKRKQLEEQRKNLQKR